MAFKTDNEMKVHTWFKNGLKKRWPDVWIYKPQGGAYGKKGALDFIFCLEGQFFSVEVKMPGNKPTPMQIKTIETIRKAKGIALVLTGRDDAIFDEIAGGLRG